MKLHKIVTKSKKRLGRGHGSGKVKTAGRGTKGQKARGTIPMGFEGGQLSLIKRLPQLRGKDRNNSKKPTAFPISVEKLNAMPTGTTVTLETLRKYHMIDPMVTRVKVLGNGNVSVKLTIEVPISKSAKQKIEKAGGTISSHE